MGRVIFVFLIFLLSGNICYSNIKEPNNYYKSEQIGPDEGLSNASAHKTYKDHLGFVWIGTSYGLNLYDGHQVIIYKNLENLGNEIIDIVEDSTHRLWIATKDKGLSYYDYDQKQFFRFDQLFNIDKIRNFVSSNIAAVYVDKYQNLWIGSYHGILRFNLISKEYEEFSMSDSSDHKLPSNEILKIEEGYDENIYFSSSEGLIIYNRKQGKIRHISLSDISGNPKSNDISDIEFDNAEKILWIGTKGGGLFKYYATNQYIEQATFVNKDEIIWSLETDNDHRLWIGGHFNLMLYNLINYHLINTYTLNIDIPTNSRIYSDIYSDSDGYIWLASEGLGITVLDPYAALINWYFKNPGDPSSLNDNVVTSLNISEEGRSIVGTRGGWLSEFDPLSNHIRNCDVIRNTGYQRDILSIYQDQNGTIYSGTYLEGIVSCSTSKHYYSGKLTESGDIRAIAYRDKHSLWIGTNNEGLFIFDKNKRTLKNVDKQGGTGALKIVKDKYGYLWVASYYGLKVFDSNNPDNYHLFVNDPNDSLSISHNTILDLLITRKGVVWIATAGGGLNKFNREDSTFTCYTESNGLANNHMVSITEDKDGLLWLGTSNGLSRFNPVTKTFRNYYIQDGLPTNIFSQRASGVLDNGTILMGTNNGLIHFDPRNLIKRDPPAKLMLTTFKINNKEAISGHKDSPLNKFIGETNKVELSYSQSNFSIGYSGLTYSKIAKTNFFYRLYPLQKEWIDAGNSQEAIFSSIPPGIYTFQLGGRLNGKEIQNLRTLTIIIKPAWWSLWWLKILASIMLLAIGAIIYQLRILSIEKENRRLEDLVSRRTKELIDINKDLSLSKQEIQQHHDEIFAKNKKLQHQNEEILSQRNNLETQKILLEKTRNKLDHTNRELNKLNQSLEEKVNERTKMLKEANSALDRFVYSASHELVAPLKSIKGLLSVMQKDPDESNKEKYESLMFDSTNKLEKLVKSLLDFSRNTRREIEINTFSLKELVTEIFNEVTYQDEKIKLINKVEDQTILYSDLSRTKIILSNLISNAIKYRDEEKDSSFVQVSYEMNCKTHKIHIADNGEGIEKEYIPRLFEMYFRGSTKSQGSGLGLYIVKEIAAVIDTNINVTSEKGKGSVFTVELPIIEK